MIWKSLSDLEIKDMHFSKFNALMPLLVVIQMRFWETFITRKSLTSKWSVADINIRRKSNRPICHCQLQCPNLIHFQKVFKGLITKAIKGLVLQQECSVPVFLFFHYVGLLFIKYQYGKVMILTIYFALVIKLTKTWVFQNIRMLMICQENSFCMASHLMLFFLMLKPGSGV